MRIAFGENASLLAAAHSAAGRLSISGVELVGDVHAFHHAAERREVVSVLAREITERDVDWRRARAGPGNSEGECAARVALLARIVGNGLFAPYGRDRRIAGNAELHPASRHDAIKTRVVVESGTD